MLIFVVVLFVLYAVQRELVRLVSRVSAGHARRLQVTFEDEIPGIVNLPFLVSSIW